MVEITKNSHREKVFAVHLPLFNNINDRPSSQINGQESLQHRVGFHCCIAVDHQAYTTLYFSNCFFFHLLFFPRPLCWFHQHNTGCLTHAHVSNARYATVPAVCDDRVPMESIKINTVRNGTIYAKTHTKHGLSILLQPHESLQQSLWPR